MNDRIVEIQVAGLRSLADVRVRLDHGLTLLIGENGAGKSALMEAVELLRRAGDSVRHAQDVLASRHGGFRSLLRHGAKEIRLGLTIESKRDEVRYEFSFVPERSYAFVGDEQVLWKSRGSRAWKRAVHRQGSVLHSASGYEFAVNDQAALGLAWWSDAPDPAKRIVAALRGIDTHFPFETRALWQQQELGVQTGPRWPAVVEPTKRLSMFGLNLASAFQALQNRGPKERERLDGLIAVGLGDDYERFEVLPIGRGELELGIRFARLASPVPVDALSDGQLAYLCFVALVELHEGRTLLSFDEPELHLHPGLVARVAWMLEEAAQHAPVIVATHSDRILDALSEPAKAVVLCELDENRATVLRRPNAERLAEWMERYRGLGSIRADGYERVVFEEDDGATAEKSTTEEER
jgi:predicted ATPase